MRLTRTTASALALPALSMLPAYGATPLTSTQVSPDITVEVDTVLVPDEAVYGTDGSATTPGSLPTTADLDAFHREGSDEVLFSLDITTDLGGVLVRRADVGSWDGADVGLAFDASAAGLPATVNVDAASRSGSDLVLSFDTSVSLGDADYDDEDLVLWSGGAFSMLLDASAAGVAANIDTDAAHVLANGNLLVSFDIAGEVGGVSFGDADVLEYDPAEETWELAFAAGDLDGWGAADVDALWAAEDVDTDGDGVSDSSDNCTLVANADQRDTNGDGIGNICDADIAPVPTNNCSIGFEDLAALKTAFFATPASPNWNPDADLDGDDAVGFSDLGLTKSNFFGEPGPSGLPNACE